MSIISNPIKDIPNCKVVAHPLIEDKLSTMRDKDCSMEIFKRSLNEIAVLMTPYITEDLSLTTKEIETPLCKMDAPVLSKQTPVIVPILRAALGMSYGIETILSNSPVGHVGVYRDPETKKPVEYLVKLPPVEGREILLVDPMLATGNSAAYAVKLLIDAGAKEENIKFIGLTAAPEGVRTLNDHYSKVDIYVASLDEKLNDHAYIVPGLGDAGDRIFGTN